MPRLRRMTTSVCDYKGLMCLTENFMKISELRKTCRCWAACDEYEYKIIYNSNEEFGSEDGTEITVSLLALPTHRYLRRAVKTNLDVVISIGGIIGLFFGSSILSLIEIVYKIMRFIQEFSKKREKNKKNSKV